MNIGTFLFSISKTLMSLGTKLYDLWTTSVSISWVSDILKFFGANVPLPDEISLSWILTSASATMILIIIIYRLFK